MRLILITALCLILACGLVVAQTSRGTITGTVADPAGAVIPGATVEAKNTETGGVYQAATTATGNYTLSELPAGVYQLSTSVSGFKQYLRIGITVMAAQVLRIDIALQVGNIAETVTVNADAPLLKTETGDLSHNVASERLDNLPVLGFSTQVRNPFAVTQLLPGTNFIGGSIRVNGSPSNTQSIRIDGQDALSGLLVGSTSMSQPSVDAVDEISVQTSNYAAEFGQAGGGSFVVTMKSGTNAFHGSAYDYWVNEALNAGVPYQNVKPRERRNNYGFTFGGPVYIPGLYHGHDKTFFFFNFEQYRRNYINSTTPQLVPTLAYRNGDFRQALTGRQLGIDPLGRPIMEGTIYDPKTERLVNGVRVRDPFPDNTIPKDRFDPVAVKIQDLIPTPTNDGFIKNYLHPWKVPVTYTIPGIKVDHNLSTRSKISFYYSRTNNASTEGMGTDGIPTVVSAAMGNFIRSYTSRLNFEQTLRPTLLLHLGAGVQGNTINDDVKNLNFDQVKELGLKGAFVTRFPRMTGLDGARGGMKVMGPNTQVTTTMLKPTANASLTWVKDNHTYKFGAEMRIEGYPNALRTNGMGMYAFSAVETGLPSTQGQNLQGGSVGFPYASFLLGAVDSGNIGYVSNIRSGKSSWAIFAQDSWKVTRRFTLDYGLRWDYQGYLKESWGRLPNFSGALPNPSTGNLPGAVVFEGYEPGHCQCNFANVYPWAFGPRLGAAYQISPKTVVRAGVGIMYGQTSMENGLSSSAGSTNPYASPSYGDPAILLRNGAPTPIPWPNLDPGQYPLPGQITSPAKSFDPNAGRPSRTIQWSLSIQREIFKNFAVEAAYVGNRGAWWEGNSLIAINALTPERIASFGFDINKQADRDLLNSRVDSALAAQRGFNKSPYASFPRSATVAQLLRPYPQFGNIDMRWAPLGRTWYDSLQVKATKRLSYGLDFTSGFTWQKELMMGSEAVGTGPGTSVVTAVNDVFNRPINKYLSMFSRPFTFFFAANYRTPKLNINRVLSLALRDWQLGTVLQYASGMPIIAPTAQNQLSTLLFRNTFANRVPGQPLFVKDLNCHCVNPSKELVLNPNAWVDPPAGQFGTSAAYYNDYRYKRRPSEAMSLGRVFRIKEKVSLSIRADFNNIFNRTQMSNPTSGGTTTAPTNAKATTSYDKNGNLTSGFGYINTGAVFANPRNGMIVARVQF
jgi:hypothetical protein